MRATNDGVATGTAKRKRARLRRRNSGQAQGKRIATRGGHRLHQPTHDPTASLATAFANAERSESAIGKRARPEQGVSGTVEAGVSPALSKPDTREA